MLILVLSSNLFTAPPFKNVDLFALQRDDNSDQIRTQT